MSQYRGERTSAYVVKHQYVTVKRTAGVFYVEGTYNIDFINYVKALPKSDRTYEPDAKRWVIKLVHLPNVLAQARVMFSKVLYGEGGDYEEMTIGGVTWKQGALGL